MGRPLTGGDVPTVNGPARLVATGEAAGLLRVLEVGLATKTQTALITGAGSGIGRGIAVALDQLGMRVALVGRDAAKLEATRNALTQASGPALIADCDVADRAAVSAMVGRVQKELGPIDVLICNAGTNVRNRSLQALDPADWDRMLATNLTGAFNLVHAVLPSMRERRGGLVVQIASIS